MRTYLNKADIVIALVLSMAVCTAVYSAEKSEVKRMKALANKIMAPTLKPLQPKGVARSVADYSSLVTAGKWTEIHPSGSVEVSAELWTRAIQTAMDENKSVRIPYTGKPYYIDAPLVIKSGSRLTVDPRAEIRLKPGINTCMLRNQNQVNGQNSPVDLKNGCDNDIVIDGGIWTTLATSQNESNGNVNGGPDSANDLHGHGVILMNRVKRVVVRNVVIKESRPHGVQFCNASEFLVENIEFIDHRRDGVHVNGPASYGVIRNIRGVTGDDMIALNAWDWKNTVMSFGPIHHMLIENVRAGIEGSDFRAEIRFLGGTKHYPDGKTLDCDIDDCVVRDISGIRTFKMYDQPNLELGRDNDFADPIGNFKNLYFSKLVIDNLHEPTFQVGSNVDGMYIDDVVLDTSRPNPGYKLVQIGPLSMTFKIDANRPDTWVEVFSPDKDCTVRNLRLSSIRERNADGTIDLKPSDCISVITQKPNPDYPNSLPKGGTGKGILID